MEMKIKFRVGLYCCCMFFFGLAFAALPPLIERISGNVGISLAVFSSLLMLRSGANMLTNLFLSSVLDRFPADIVLACSLLLFPIAAAILPATHSIPMLVLSLILYGIGGALVENGCNTQLSRLLREKSGTASYLMYTALSLGAVLSPAMLSWAMRRGEDLNRFPMLTLLPVLIPAGCLLFLPEVQSESVDAPEEAAAAAQPAGKKLPGLVILAAFFMFFASGGESTFSSLGSAAVAMENIATAEDAALLTSVYWAGTLLSRFLNMFLEKRMSAQHRLRISIGAMLLCSIGLFIAPAFSLGPLLYTAYPLVLVLTLLFGLGSGGIFSTLLICLNRVLVPGGKQIGFILGVNAAGIMLLPSIGGWLLDNDGYGLFILGTCAALLIACLLQIPISHSRKAKVNS